MTQIDQLAQDEQVSEIDIHGALRGYAELFPDRVHPNDKGAALIAQTVARAIRG